MRDTLKAKLVILIVSIVIVAIVIALYFLDTSLGWGKEKIISCVIVCLWLFFIVPSLRYFFMKVYTMNAKQGSLAVYTLLTWGGVTVLFPPWNALKYYFDIDI